jgi:hypothetical protein
MVEKLKYQVIKKLKKAEIRRYDSFVIARIDGMGDQGFNVLFRFISGNNKQRRKVDMTAPVVSEKISMTAPVLSDTGSIAFVMPEGYTLESTPEPIDDRIEVKEIPPRSVAALRFSGRWSKTKFDQKAMDLLGELRESGIKTKGNVFAMRYSGPFTLWFMRRNEVVVEIELES